MGWRSAIESVQRTDYHPKIQREVEREKKREGEKKNNFQSCPLFSFLLHHSTKAFLHSLLYASGHVSELPVTIVSALFFSWALRHWESSVRTVTLAQMYESTLKVYHKYIIECPQCRPKSQSVHT